MPDFSLDRPGLIFCSLSLALTCWAVFDTPRFVRLLSLNRRTVFTDTELLIIRVPGVVVLLGLSWLLLNSLLRRG
jgi:hypothetical protein